MTTMYEWSVLFTKAKAVPSKVFDTQKKSPDSLDDPIAVSIADIRTITTPVEIKVDGCPDEAPHHIRCSIY